MSTTDYASAVAAVKTMESSLLTRSDIEQFINAPTLSELRTLLDSRTGGETLEDVWKMLSEYAPDCAELKILLYRNDLHNLKAVLKAMLSGRDPSNYYISPSNVSLETIKDAYASKSADSLPVYMRAAAEEAYEVATRTLDGQLSDSLIDSAALTAMQQSADETGNDFIIKYAQLTTACADIKTAYRCSVMHKSNQFMETAVCGSRELDKASLIRAALAGKDGLFNFLNNTPYAEAAELLKNTPAQFEKWCDDVITEHAESARMQAFGAEPLMAYYIAKEAEIKNIRIISICRESGTDRDTITERMRKLYV